MNQLEDEELQRDPKYFFYSNNNNNNNNNNKMSIKLTIIIIIITIIPSMINEFIFHFHVRILQP